MPNTSAGQGAPPKKNAGSTNKNSNATGGATGNPKGGGGKSASAKKTAATTRFAERQAKKEEAARAARQERNKRYALITIVLVVCIVAALVIVKLASGGGNSSADQVSPPRGTPIPPASLAKLDNVSIASLHAAPATGIISTPQAVNGKALTADGKPELLYIGAEFCPHCAAERWPLYVALSKFGTFSPAPGRIHSAIQEGNVPTLTFYGTTYSSPYLSFTPVEVYTNKPAPGGGYTALQTPTNAQAKLWQQGNGGSFPYLNFGGKVALSGAQFSYADLQGMLFRTVANQVGNNSSVIGANIGASASDLIKTICVAMTNNQPASVCSS